MIHQPKANRETRVGCRENERVDWGEEEGTKRKGDALGAGKEYQSVRICLSLPHER